MALNAVFSFRILGLPLVVFAVLSSSAEASSETYYQYLHGLLEERAGHVASALTDYQKVVTEDPQAREVYRDIAQLQLRLGHAPDAVAAALKAKDLSPDDADSYLFLGNVYLAQGNLAKSADAYEETLKRDPQNTQALENLGNYYSIVDPAKAIGYFKKELDVQPRDSEIHFRLGLAYEKAGQPAPAVEEFKTAVGLTPDQPGPHLALAAYYETIFSTASAITEYQAALKTQPQNPLVWDRLGHLYYESEEWDEADSALENSRSIQPGDPTVHYWLARVAEEQQRWKDAATHAEEAYRLSQDSQFLPLVSYYLTLDHRSAESIPYLEKAREKHPTDPNVYLFLGMNELDLHHDKKALEALQEGVHIAPNDVQMHFQLGIAKDRLNRFDPAMAEFEKVLVLDPENAAAMNYLGFSWADRGIHLEEAETLLRHAVKIEPTNGAYLDSLGWVRFKRGDRAEAIQWLEKSLAATPDPLIYDHLADVLHADGQWALARDAWVKALAMDPKNKAIRKKLDDVNRHVLVHSDPRKTLKYIEGNNLQILRLTATAKVDARWKGAPIHAVAQWSYVKPDRATVEVPGPDGNPAFTIQMAGDEVRIEPESAAHALSGLSLQGLTAIPQFFSGQLLKSFDQPSTVADNDRKKIRYHQGVQEAWVDVTRGVLTHVHDAQGVTMDIPSYGFVDGLWLPEDVRLEDGAHHWKARLRFSDWRVN